MRLGAKRRPTTRGLLRLGKTPIRANEKAVAVTQTRLALVLCGQGFQARRCF